MAKIETIESSYYETHIMPMQKKWFSWYRYYRYKDILGLFFCRLGNRLLGNVDDDVEYETDEFEEDYSECFDCEYYYECCGESEMEW